MDLQIPRASNSQRVCRAIPLWLRGMLIIRLWKSSQHEETSPSAGGSPVLSANKERVERTLKTIWSPWVLPQGWEGSLPMHHPLPLGMSPFANRELHTVHEVMENLPHTGVHLFSVLTPKAPFLPQEVIKWRRYQAWISSISATPQQLPVVTWAYPALPIGNAGDLSLPGADATQHRAVAPSWPVISG